MGGTGDSAVDAALSVYALGSLDIRRNGESVQHLIPQKAAILVAYLADQNQVARRSRVAGLMYSDLREERARANLRVVLTRLRSALPGVVGSDREYLWLEQSPHYDVHELASASDGDAVLVHYRGDFLADVDAKGAPLLDEWVAARRQNLRATAIGSLTSAGEKAQASSDWDSCQRYASRLLELEPWNEAAHRQLMSALAAKSGPSAALAQFHECEAILRSEMGLSPSGETTALRDSIQQGSQVRQAARPSLKSNIPHELTPFVGRSHELPIVCERLTEGDYRLLTIVGPGGAGKTRLATEAARASIDSFPAGVFFVPLAQARSLNNVLASVLEVLAPSAPLSLADAGGQIAELVGDQRMCLILDNLEQVVDEAAKSLTELLGHCAELRLLITSRQPLGVRGEDIVLLGGLEVPEPGDSNIGGRPSVRLFVDRAYRANKTFSLSNEVPEDVATLCRLVEGMPLHLELVAARTASEDVGSLLDRLQNAEPLSGEGLRDTPDRHRTFDAVFEHSWSTLEDDERDALSLLSVTQGGFDSAAAAAILGSTGLEASRLARKSLLVEEGNSRFRFHELLRQSAHARLDTARLHHGEKEHARWYLTALAEASTTLISSRAKEARARLLADLDNVRAAWSAAIRHDMVVELGTAAPGLGYLFEIAGNRAEGASLLFRAADAARDAKLTPKQGFDEAFFARIAAGLIASISTDERVEATCDRVDALLEGLPDRAVDRAWSTLHRAQSAFYRSDLATAALLLDGCEDNVGVDPAVEGWTMLQRGRLLSAIGSFDDAVATYRRALEQFEKLDDVRAQALTHSYLAPTYAEQNLVWKAFEADRSAMTLSELTGNEQRLGDLHLNLGASFVLLGSFEPARAHSAAALTIFRETGDLQVEGYALAQHGECLLGLGERTAGEADMVEGLFLSRQQGFSYGLLYNLPPWIRHLESCGRSSQALVAADELLDIARGRDADHFVLSGAALRARSLTSLGRLNDAVVLARQTLDALDAPDPPRLPWPVATLLDLAVVFRAADDPIESTLVARAADIQQATARTIADPELRRSYLDDLPASIELRRSM